MSNAVWIILLAMIIPTALAGWAICLHIDAQGERERKVRERFNKLQMEYAEKTRRPAGLDFYQWERELTVKDWT